MEFAKPKLIVISAPSGSGKTSVFKGAKALLPNLIFSISYTTRSPREGELEGADYFFTDPGHFQQMISEDQFLEWAEVYGNYYGTSRDFISRSQQEGKIVILDIDVQGAMQLKQIKDLDAVYIFIMPPSLEELSIRLISRGTESEESLRKRLNNAEKEISFRDQYNYQIVNGDLEQAVDEFLKVVISECYELKGELEPDIKSVIDRLHSKGTDVPDN